MRNSWGPNWGMEGYFTLPYDYVTHPTLARDFWTIYTVEPDTAAPKGRRRTTRKKTTGTRKRTAAAKR